MILSQAARISSDEQGVNGPLAAFNNSASNSGLSSSKSKTRGASVT